MIEIASVARDGEPQIRRDPQRTFGEATICSLAVLRKPWRGCRGRFRRLGEQSTMPTYFAVLSTVTISYLV